jgi:curved DNA-binding protein CbpA
MSAGPFAVLGLTAHPDLTDDEVRAAWRRIAAATHPDRDDGGDPAAFAAAAAAYTDLRTQTGRREALADRLSPHGRGPSRRGPGGHRLGRLRRGRPAVLAARLAVAAAVSLGAVVAAGARPATYAVIAGAVTWLLRTARRELAPGHVPDTPTRPR